MMNTSQRISIIIPCYNGARFLRQTLESVRWQTFTDWECILVDDGSTDDSAAIFSSFAGDDRRFIYHFQKNAGLAAARNSGIQLAKGEYIQFLDADDVMLKDRLENCLNVFRTQRSADVVYSDFVTYQAGQGFLTTLPAKIPNADTVKAILFEFNITFAIVVHSLLLKRDVIAKNLFDTELHSHAEDYDCWIRVAMSGARFYYCPGIQVVYRFSDNNLTSNEVKLISAKMTVLEKYQRHFNGTKYREEFASALLYYRQRLAMGYFMQKSFGEGFRLIKSIAAVSSFSALMKMCGWGILMLFFSKSFVAEARGWIVKHTPFKWGGWKNAATWHPPGYLIELLGEEHS